MDMQALETFVKHKKLTEAAETIKTKINTENKHLIKIQVSQHTSLWEAKEELEKTKRDYEQLQQNMLELQTQYEALSGQYEQQVRYRPEDLNRIDGTRKICEELERSVQRMQVLHSKTVADLTSLYDAYKRSNQAVLKLQQDHLSMKEQAITRIRGLEDQLRQEKKHQSQVSGLYEERDQRAEAERLELLSQLQATRSAWQELTGALDDMTAKQNSLKAELDKKNAAILNLQREMQNIVKNFRKQSTDTENILKKKENDLKNASEELESLKQALSNQEQFTKTQCERNSELQEKLALLEEEHQNTAATSEQYRIELQEITSACQNLKDTIAQLVEKNEALTKDLKEKEEMINLFYEQDEAYKIQILQYDSKLDKVTAELAETKDESQKNIESIEKLEAEIETLRKNLSDIETAFNNYREAAEENSKQQAAVIEDTKKEIEEKTSIIIKDREEIAKLNDELLKQAVALQEINNELEAKTTDLIKIKSVLESEEDEHSKILVELQKQTEIIKELELEIQHKTSTIVESKEECDKLQAELQKRAAVIDEKTMELELQASALNQEKKRRNKLETDLQKLRRDRDKELEAAEENEKALKAKIFSLEVAVRAKDEELSREMSSFLRRRNELEKEKSALQGVINGLEKKIENIMKAASNAGPVAPRLRPETDDNAMLTPPHNVPPARSTTRPQQPRGYIKDALYDFDFMESDASVDSIGIRRPHAEKRYFAMFAKAGDKGLPPAPAPATLKRARRSSSAETAAAPVGVAQPLADTNNTAPGSKTKERRFFKTNRQRRNK